MNSSSHSFHRRLGDIVLIAFLGILWLAFSIGEPNFLYFSNLISILTNFSLLLILSLGITWVIMIGSLDVSQAGIAGLAGILIGLTLPTFGVLSILLAILVGAGFGFLNGFIFTKARIPSFLVTLGILFVTTGLEKYIAVLAHVLTNGIPIGSQLDGFLPVIPFLGLPRSFSLFYWAVGTTLLLYFVSQRTSLGLRTYAVGSNISSSYLHGIKVVKYQILVFTLSGTLSAIAGFLYLPYLGTASPTFTDSFTFITLAAVVLGGTALAGGTGGFHRTLLGAFILSTMNNGLTVLGVDALVVFILQGLIIIIAAAVVGRGISSGAIQ
jgi:ribose/xylose/arabinose/galactoside ABC-type transport system permease subunit